MRVIHCCRMLWTAAAVVMLHLACHFVEVHAQEQPPPTAFSHGTGAAIGGRNRVRHGQIRHDIHSVGLQLRRRVRPDCRGVLGRRLARRRGGFSAHARAGRERGAPASSGRHLHEDRPRGRPGPLWIFSDGPSIWGSNAAFIWILPAWDVITSMPCHPGSTNSPKRNAGRSRRASGKRSQKHAAGHPAVFCYDLMNEPVVGKAEGWPTRVAAGRVGGFLFRAEDFE